MEAVKFREQVIRLLWILVAAYLTYVINCVSKATIGGFQLSSARLSGLITIVWYLLPFCGVLVALLLGPLKLRIAALLLGAVFMFFTLVSFFALGSAVDAIRFDKDTSLQIVERKEIASHTYLCRYQVDFGATTHVEEVLQKETEILPGLLWVQIQ